MKPGRCERSRVQGHVAHDLSCRGLALGRELEDVSGPNRFLVLWVRLVAHKELSELGNKKEEISKDVRDCSRI
jgi:hypothetical protein